MPQSGSGHRRPRALLPAGLARLGGFAGLALLGALEWQRLVTGVSVARAMLWVLVAVAAAALVLWGDARSRRPGTVVTLAAVAGLLAAFLASGLDLALLKPRQWDDLGAGLAQGTEMLGSVPLPYRGEDPWPGLTLQLTGSVLVMLAALLAFWPRAQGRGYPFLSLAALLVLVASPVISLGSSSQVVLGVALTALTICFLWLERLPLRPGLGVAAMGALALAGALPLASAADGEDPWFDYATFAESLGAGEPVRFDWGHSYGPITWPRDGGEVLRIKTRRPAYWKVRTLGEFDGGTWREEPLPAGPNPALDLPRDFRVRGDWTQRLEVTVRRLRGTDVVTAGTALDVESDDRLLLPDRMPGQWRAATELRSGDTYTVEAHIPRPTPRELAQSAAGADARQFDELVITLPLELGSRDPQGLPVTDAEVRFASFGAQLPPLAVYADGGPVLDGRPALRQSGFRRTWQLSRRLRARAKTPYDYVVAVDRYLQDGFTYDEIPERTVPGLPVLDSFLFDTKSGYCQHYSGAMALLLRMGGIPARVVTGFSPGGYSDRKGAWVVRDTDAHSWVEAWFDDVGWVTFDPTPPATPARSQIASLDPVPEDEGDDGAAAGDAGDSGASRTEAVRPDLLGGVERGAAGGAAGGGGDGGPAWWWAAVGALPLLAAGVFWLARRRWRRWSAGTRLERLVRELERALRRWGRLTPGGTTFAQLEARLGRTPDAAAYLRSLQSGRYAPRASLPTPAQRRALRRELASGLGRGGRLRALWALPPWRS